jgi:type III secretion protein L
MTKKIASPDGSRLVLKNPVLKASEVSEFVEAKIAVQRAKSQAEKLLREARKIHEKAREKGYQEGLKAGNKDSAAQMIGVIAGSVDYLQKTETQLAALVIATVSKILGNLDQDELILNSVRRSLAELRNQQRVTVRAAPRNANTLLEGLPRTHPEVEILNIVADERLSDSECVIETDIGIVNVNRDEFVNVLKDSIVERLGIGKEQFETELEQQMALETLGGQDGEKIKGARSAGEAESEDLDLVLDLSHLELEPLR